MLSFFAKKAIEYYWKNVPADKRRVCIYKVSCSKFVYDKIETRGFISGVKAYLSRIKNCNAHYSISKVNDEIQIKTKSGIFLYEEQINPVIIKEFRLK